MPETTSEHASRDHAGAKRRPYRRSHGLIWAGYAAMVVLSIIFNQLRPTSAITPIARDAVELPERVYYDTFGPSHATPVPVLLMHGSPGDASSFTTLASLLARDGRMVIAPDLLGFGMSDDADNLGYQAQSDAMLAMLDQLGIDRVHAVGWSNGGGVALWMAHNAPERVASITLLASVGAQETEGTGEYAFEHFKYKLGRIVLGPGLELIPHFGLLGRPGERTRWLRNFDDSDQRNISGFMPSLSTPTMIMHGRHDFLVYDWAAEHHHTMIPGSRLVMLDASHFIPMLQAEQAASYLAPFFARHDTAGITPETGVVYLAPVPERGLTATALYGFARWLRGVPWWLTLPFIMVLTRVRPTLTTVLAGVLVGTTQIDFALAGLGVLLGRAWWCMLTGGLDHPTTAIAWLRSIGWSLLSFFIAWLLLGREFVLPMTDRLGIIGLALGFAASYLLLTILRHAWSWTGRRRLLGFATEAHRQEYWPSWIRYLPCYATFAWWVWRAKGRAVPTAVNPGYAQDGGIAEEKKHEVLARIPDPAMLYARLIPAHDDTAHRAHAARDIADSDPELGGYPMIIKPDQGERGRGVRIAHSGDDLDDYLNNHQEPAVLQRYHPGPIEVGILWARRPGTISTPPGVGEMHGEILSINAKALPVIEGDGRRTLARLILAHPRYRVQADVFFERCKDRLGVVPGAGERVALGSAGNHAQGAMFTDASHLITPELEARIDAIARCFVGGFDIGRFDVRCESEDMLRRAEGLAVIELNGVTSEPTAIYDPSWNIFRAQRTLWRYWSRVVALGIARRESGTGLCMPWPEVARVLLAWRWRALKRAVHSLLRLERPNDA